MRSLDVHGYRQASNDQQQAMQNWITDSVGRGELLYDINWIVQICILRFPTEGQDCIVKVEYMLPDARGRKALVRKVGDEHEIVKQWHQHRVATPPPFGDW